MSSINNNLLPAYSEFDFTDKIGGSKIYVNNQLRKCLKMFKWKGLPDTIKQRDLELMLLTHGYAVITRADDGQLYAFTNTGLGDGYDGYYFPKKAIIANPWLHFDKTVNIDRFDPNRDAVLIGNDSLYEGLWNEMLRYGNFLAECDATLRLNIIQSRIISLITSDDDNTTKSALSYIEDIIKGKMGIIAESSFLEGLKTQPYAGASTTNSITAVVELIQYLKSSFDQDCGLPALLSLKRETLNDSEIDTSNEGIFPIAEDMLEMRKQGAEELSKIFGQEVTVEFDSAWEIEEAEQELELEQLENPVEEEPEEIPEETPAEEVADEVEEEKKPSILEKIFKKKEDN